MASALLAAPSASQTKPSIAETLPSFNPYSLDPNGTLYAFNSTVSTMDLYTNSSATVGGNNDANVTWFSSIKSTSNNTSNGQPLPGTGFHFNLDQLPAPSPSIRETINYTLNVPKGAGASTYVRFEWNGTVGPGTGARYLLSNSTSYTNADRTKIFVNLVRPSNLTGPFSGGNFPSPTGGLPLPCGRTDECFDITNYVGFNITLTFLFNSTATASTGHLAVSVSNVEVASLGPPTPAVSHSMSPSTNPTQIDHNGRLVVSYNSTVTYHKPNTTNQSITHPWHTVLLSFYMPKTYTSNTVSLESIPIDNSTLFFTTHGFSQGFCTTQGIVMCTRSLFFSINVTGFLEGSNRNVQVSALTVNALTSITTGIGAVDTDSWVPGDNITLRVMNSPGVNVSGIQIALLEPVSNTNGQIPLNVTLSSSAQAGSANYTIAIPTSLLSFGKWILTLTFTNGFDYGIKTHPITIDEIQVNSDVSVTGGVGKDASIEVSGKLSYLSNASLPLNNCNVGIFAIGQGTTRLLANNGPPGTGLYISNVTSVVGVGSPQQPIIMYFSLVTSNATNRYDANITIDHEWYPGATHGVNVTIPLTPTNIDNGNNFQFTPVTYGLQALITPNGIQLTLQSLATKSQITVNMTPGVGGSAVPSLREHFGNFKITLHAKNRSTQVVETPLPSVESPPYAYLLYTQILPSSLLAYNSTVTAASNGSFSGTLPTNQLVGIKELHVIVLARDVDGIVLGDETRNPTILADSSVLQPSANLPGSFAVQQSVDVTLHLKSNSTYLVAHLTVNLDFAGPASFPTKTSSITIQPGATADVKFNFTAPSRTGTYTMTFSSPEYGGTGSPLLAKTVVVSLVSSTFQFLIPAIIGLVAAAIATVYYKRRRVQVETEASERTKPKTTGSTKSNPESHPRNP